jgi:hypothetical protein
MPKKLLFPEDILARLLTRFNNSRAEWLTGEGTWPLSLPLGTPTEKDVAATAADIRQWVEAWREWPAGACELAWEDRAWPRLGRQSLPSAVMARGPEAIAGAVRQGPRWRRAVARHARLAQRWPVLRTHAVAGRHFNVLADYHDDDFERLFGLLEWLDANPRSGMYLRQLPVLGLDTKWTRDRRGLILDLITAIRGGAGERDFYDACGLVKPAHRLRLRILCPQLRAAFGGLGDFEAPLGEVAAMPLMPARAIIVENLETGVALPDLPGCVALMKLGLAVGVVSELPWLRGIPAVYWGDLDTHGFVILDRARTALPQLTSVLMDVDTVASYLPLAGTEPQQHPRAELATLCASERAVYEGLYADTWGPRLRIEQERLPWAVALEKIEEAIGAAFQSGRAGP